MYSEPNLDAELNGFAENGFVAIPRLLSSTEVERYLKDLEDVSGRSRTSKAKRGDAGWTQPDGLTRNRQFWDLIFHDRLLSVVRGLLGANICFLQHTDLHVGFSSFNWHRDCVNRTPGVGPDWDESDAPYRIVRVGLYLQPSGTNFKLGLIPGTHRKTDARAMKSGSALGNATGPLSHLRRLLTGKVPDVPGSRWVSAAAGDAVIFDPRVLHTGTPVDGEKFSVFLAYGIPNRHFEHHSRYYRHARTDLRYATMPLELIERLKASDLYYPVTAGATEDASLPSALEALAIRKTQQR